MNKQHTHNIKAIIFTFMMVFCIVFSSALKTVIDQIDTTKKTTQILDEEHKESEEDSKKEKDVMPFFKPKQASSSYSIQDLILNTTYKCELNAIRPFFKIHTPPPDIS